MLLGEKFVYRSNKLSTILMQRGVTIIATYRKEALEVEVLHVGLQWHDCMMM